MGCRVATGLCWTKVREVLGLQARRDRLGRVGLQGIRGLKDRLDRRETREILA